MEEDTVIDIDLEEEDGCIICLETINETDKYIIENCDHQYHRGCIETWYNNNVEPSCPLCRRPFIDQSLINLSNQELIRMNILFNRYNEENRDRRGGYCCLIFFLLLVFFYFILVFTNFFTFTGL